MDPSLFFNAFIYLATATPSFDSSAAPDTCQPSWNKIAITATPNASNYFMSQERPTQRFS